MKLWLDDERPAPDGWVLAKTYQDAIDYLWDGGLTLRGTESVTHLSLDHDLGTEETGYSVMIWIEQIAHHCPEWPVPEITCHSANPVGRKRIEMVIEKLKRVVMTDCDGNSQKGM